LIQPPLLVLAHMRERRWRNRDPFAPGRPAPVLESGSVTASRPVVVDPG
jgi:hypothetical protein